MQVGPGALQFFSKLLSFNVCVCVDIICVFVAGDDECQL